jgi:cytochrome b6-f complex iron-sulfur subunit
MSTDSSGGPQKKLSTAEILAKARAEKAAKAAAEAAASGGAAAPAEIASVAAEAASPVADVPAVAPVAAAKPKSTADILAAARATAAAKSAAAATGAPEAPAAAKPKSTADILAAARATAAAKAAGGAVAETSPVAGAKPAVAKPVAATGPKPSVQEMLAAVRAGAAASPVAASKDVVAAGPKAAAPPMPARPAAPVAKKAPAVETRRSFLATAVAACLSPFWVAWASFAAATLASTLACLRFMLPNVLTEPPSKFKVGPPGDYDLGTVSEKFKAQFGIWIVHTDKFQGKNLVYALSTVCTHLGCTPSWLDGEQKYKCPCHGSGFYITGINFEGPAPRPLERVGLRLAEDGMLEVDKSLKFQEEMGQWNDPASYVEIG